MHLSGFLSLAPRYVYCAVKFTRFKVMMKITKTGLPSFEFVKAP